MRFMTAAALAGGLLFAGCADEPELPPSVILISLDTLRADHVGFLGHERDTTPFLDELAEESLVFERAFATSCWTLSSHMTILTGLYADQHGVVANEAALNPNVPLLAERLSDRGYATVGLYELGWIHERHGFARGFDVFRNHLDAEEAAAHLAEEIPKLPEKRPFFLFLHLFDIHCDPLLDAGKFYNPPPEYEGMFRADAAEALAGIDFKRALKEPGLLNADQLDALIATYDGGIRYVDDRLREWITDWRERGLLDRAILIITSDHGEALGQRAGDLDKHGGMYQEALRVPLLVRYPDGRRAGERRSEPVHSVDIVPTLLRDLGLPEDARLPGYPLVGERPADDVMTAMLDLEFAYIRWPWKIRGDRQRMVAHNLDEDPLELSPLSPGDPAAGDAFLSVYADLKAQRAKLAPMDTKPIQAAEPTAEAAAQLRAIGYADALDDDG